MPHHVTFVAMRVAGQGKLLQNRSKNPGQHDDECRGIKILKVTIIKAGCVGAEDRCDEN